MDQLIYAPAATLAKAIRDRQVSSVEVIAAAPRNHRRVRGQARGAEPVPSVARAARQPHLDDGIRHDRAGDDRGLPAGRRRLVGTEMPR